MRAKNIIITLSAFLCFISTTAFAQIRAEDVLFYINQYRARHWLAPLKMNVMMSQKALQHSQDMATHKQPFGHLGFNTRLAYLKNHIANVVSGAENVAYNYKTAKIVVDNWMTSPGHRQNILGHYNLTGIGIAQDKLGHLYYTQIFLKVN